MPALDKVVIVTRKTRMQELVARYNTPDQAKFRVRQQLANYFAEKKSFSAKQAMSMAESAVQEYEDEDDAYKPAIEALHRRIEDLDVEVQTIDRSLVSTFQFNEHHVVVTLGQDGLIANCAKYAGEQPIVGVNPDPKRFDGVLLPFTTATAVAAVERVLQGTARSREATLAEVKLNDGQRLLAFNDLFIGAKSHVSARYRIRRGDQAEDHSSSGLIVSTGAGSTGWLSSMFNMAAGLTQSAGGKPGKAPELKWEDRDLFFVVREPFVSRTSSASIVAGKVSDAQPLEIESLMAEGGVIFSDGVESDYLEFNSGSLAAIRPAARRARLVVG